MSKKSTISARSLSYVIFKYDKIIRSRGAMHMWCPDGIGRDRWDRGGQGSVGWLALIPPNGVVALTGVRRSSTRPIIPVVVVVV